jgi:dTMP kinase
VIITFEGGEGAGKTTHAALLCSHLTSKGLSWISLREPGGSSFSEEVRSLFFREGLDVMTELLLVLASRRQNIREVIEPGLSRGKIVVIDRFVDSTLVYQGIVGGLGYGAVRKLMEMSGTWLEPDLTFVMDVDPAIALNRIKPGDKFERKGIDYHQKLRDAFLGLAGDSRHRIIDSGQSRERVASEIISIVDGFLALRATGAHRKATAKRKGGSIMRKLSYSVLVFTMVIFLVEGCTTDPFTGEQKMSKTAWGSIIGAAGGAAVGAAVSKDKRKGALIGAGIGGLTGAGVGYYMDQQEAKLRQKLQGTGVSVTRQGDNIILNMPGNITFQTNSADINANFYNVLNSVVLVLNEFNKTLIDVYGHTDSTGSDAINQPLSERRASSVGQYLISQGIDSRRVATQGFGKTRPIASNDTPEGRSQNRRVELQLVPLTQ